MPWLSLLFLVVVPFVTQHDLDRPLERRDELNPTQEEQLEWVEEGEGVRRAAFLLLMGFGFVGLVRRGRVELRVEGALGYTVLLFAGWALASLAWTDAADLTARRLVVFLAMALGAAAVVKHFSLRHFALWLFVTNLVYLLIGVLTEIHLGTLHWIASGERFAGTLHPNNQAMNCALLTLSGMALAMTTRRGRSLLMAGSLFGFTFLVLTRSRTAFVSLIVASLFLAMLRLSAVRRVWLVGSLILGGSFALLLLEASSPVLRSVVLLGREHEDTSRLEIWQETLSYLPGHRLQGYGYQAFWTPRRIDEISQSQYWGVAEAHSSYLDVLMSLGIVGVALYVASLLGGLGRALTRHRSTGDVGWALLASLLVFAILDGILESGPVLATPISLVTMTAVAYLALVPSVRCAPGREGLEP